jgi:hypothetical protein
MRNLFLLALMVAVCSLAACTKDKLDDIPKNLPHTEVPAELQHLWMHGYFSTTEYWPQDPATYIGNPLEIAIAFKYNADGTYTHYFTSSVIIGGVTTYNQSVTVGTVEIDPVNQTIKTHPYKSHYKRTSNGKTVEDRDLRKEEIRSATTYSYSTGVETSGTKALYLTLENTTSPLTFLQKE